jgi:hypothetical protein
LICNELLERETLLLLQNRLRRLFVMISIGRQELPSQTKPGCQERSRQSTVSPSPTSAPQRGAVMDCTSAKPITTI